MVQALEFAHEACQQDHQAVIEDHARRAEGRHGSRVREGRPSTTRRSRPSAKALCVGRHHEAGYQHRRQARALRRRCKAVSQEACIEKPEGRAGRRGVRGEKSRQIKAIFEELKYEYMRDLTVQRRPHRWPRARRRSRASPSRSACCPAPTARRCLQRGETQALVTATLGTSRRRAAHRLAAGRVTKRFMLHYNFPPFSVNGDQAAARQVAS
jgi:polyribonucleotide nucleotidyltransferase